MRRALLFVSILSIVSSIAAWGATAPTLTVADEKGRTALALDAVAVHTVIRGHLARTIFELTYRNDLDHVVAGDFAFPLPADAEVSDLGLYFNGHLRHGVAVERVQARTAFEQVVHRRADPALAEWAAGRAFRLSIFPIDANGGTKTVSIAYDQELIAQPYTLDLRWGATVGRLDVAIDSDGQRVDADGLDLRRDGATWRAHATKIALAATVSVTRNSADETALTAWSPEDGRWYASAPVRVGYDPVTLPPASRVLLLWDVSGSAARRDDQRVLAFLRALNEHGDRISRVIMVPFHIAFEPPREMALDAFEPPPTAGATNLSAVLEQIPSMATQLSADTRIVLVTDGVGSLDDDARTARAAAALTAISRPLLVINASPSPNDQLLGAMARASGGWYVDLTRVAPDAAAESARHLPSRQPVESAWLPLREVVPSSVVTSGEETISISAWSRAPIGELQFRENGRRRVVVARDAALPAEAGDLIRRAWARARLRELVDAGASDAALLEHGRRFNQLTPRTSLLVLESYRDYETYGVPMPPDVRAEKEAAERDAAQWQRPGKLHSRGRSSEPSPGGAAWFIKGTVRDPQDDLLPGVTVTLTAEAIKRVAITDAFGRYWIELPASPGAFTLDVTLEGFGTARRSYRAGMPSGSVIDATLSAAVSESITVTASSPAINADNSVVEDGLDVSLVAPTPEALADRLLAGIASAPVVFTEDEEIATQAVAKRHATIEQIVEKLRSLPASDQLRYYIAARSVLGGDKWFHAHAALAIHDIDPKLATRLLTDLAEAYPNDAPLLRIVGRIVDGWGEPALARMLFARALALAPHETQTWRELLLLESRSGDEKSLADVRHRYQSAEHDARFGQVEQQLESELPRLGRPLTDARVDPSADLQVEAMWDSNYADVDLHVIEPGGEEVFYSHQRSANGGLLHDDITTGYGPEVYTIPRAAAGDYKIEIDYYGADRTAVDAETLVHVVIYQRGARRDEVIVLGGAKDRVAVTTLHGKGTM